MKHRVMSSTMDGGSERLELLQMTGVNLKGDFCGSEIPSNSYLHCHLCKFANMTRRLHFEAPLPSVMLLFMVTEIKGRYCSL